MKIIGCKLRYSRITGYDLIEGMIFGKKLSSKTEVGSSYIRKSHAQSLLGKRNTIFCQNYTIMAQGSFRIFFQDAQKTPFNAHNPFIFFSISDSFVRF